MRVRGRVRVGVRVRIRVRVGVRRSLTVGLTERVGVCRGGVYDTEGLLLGLDLGVIWKTPILDAQALMQCRHRHSRNRPRWPRWRARGAEVDIVHLREWVYAGGVYDTGVWNVAPWDVVHLREWV